MPESPYLAAAVGALKESGRVVFSGGLGGDVAIPYGKMVHDNLTVKGKWMYSPDGARRLITPGVLKIGRDSGAEIGVYGLEQHDEAVEAAAKNGGWRNYAVIKPNAE